MTDIDVQIIAHKLIDALSYDNNYTFKPTQSDWKLLFLVIASMDKEFFTDENIDFIVSGETSEVFEKFYGVPGYIELDVVLNSIFETV